MNDIAGHGWLKRQADRIREESKHWPLWKKKAAESDDRRRRSGGGSGYDSIQTVIVCAAVRNREGDIICGPRHYDDIMRNQIRRAGGIEKWRNFDQGFVDQFCNFYTRKEAFRLAEKNGQIKSRCGGDDGTLFSENLY